MKKFLSKLLTYLLLIGLLVILYILLIAWRPDLVDNFYYRFTTEKANSLVLGGSRAAQGIIPDVFNDSICNKKNKLINHAFALGPSSFGPNYYKEITKKLKNESSSGLFIISINPWSLSTRIENTSDDSLMFFEVERNMFVGNLNSSNSNPNFDYLTNYWNEKFHPFEMIFKHLMHYEGILELHENGWLEVNINMDSASLNNRVLNSTTEYKEKAKNVKFSYTRLFFLEKIIRYLEKRGDIYFVRLPVSVGMAEIEKTKFPEFENIIQQLAGKYNIKYINFINSSGEYLTTDTHHLWKEESELISQQICDSILTYRKSKLYPED